MTIVLHGSTGRLWKSLQGQDKITSKAGMYDFRVKQTCNREIPSSGFENPVSQEKRLFLPNLANLIDKLPGIPYPPGKSLGIGVLL